MSVQVDLSNNVLVDSHDLHAAVAIMLGADADTIEAIRWRFLDEYIDAFDSVDE